MRVNQKNNSVLLLAETAKQVSWAINYLKRFQISEIEQSILPLTDEAQVALLKLGYSYDFYIAMQPQVKEKYKILRISDDFSREWYENKKIYNGLKFENADLGRYLITHWLNFLPLVLISNLALMNAIKNRHPKKIIYFNKDWSLQQSYLGAALESFVLHYEKALIESKYAVQIEEVFLNSKNTSPKPFSWFNLKKYFDLITEDRSNLFLIAKILWDKKNIIERRLKKGDLLVFADRHILVDSKPLIEALRTQGLELSIVGAYMFIFHKIGLFRAKIRYFDYHSINTKSQIKKEKYSIFWEKYKKSSSYHQLIAKYNFENLESLLTAKIDSFFDSNLESIFTNFERACKIIQTVKPKKILVFSNYGVISLSLCFAAKKIGAEIYVLQHGIMPTPKTVYSDVYDHMLVYGNVEKFIHTHYFRMNTSTVHILGWYYIDPLTKQMLEYRAKNKIDLSKKKLTVLYVTTIDVFNHSAQIKIISEMIKTLSSLPQVELIIRPHPGHTFSKELEKLYKAKNIVVKWDFGKNLDQQLKKADIIITQPTTVGLRAMLWGKPVIHLVPEGTVDIAAFSRYGAAVKVTKLLQLGSEIKKMISNKKKVLQMPKNQLRLLRDYAYRIDGKSSERIAKFISSSDLP